MSAPLALIVTEGALEIPVCLRLFQNVGISTEGVRKVNKAGGGAFWRDIERYNRAAASVGCVFALADLERFPCPSGLIQQHLTSPIHPHFVLRIAERMLESWLLADPTLASFLGVPMDLLPLDPDAEPNPKQTLVNLARRSPSRHLRSDLVPEAGSLGIVGKGYSPRMTEFIEKKWQPSIAESRSESLRRALKSLRKVTNA